MASSGPFFLGRALSLVDIHAAPYAIRLHLLLPHYFPKMTVASALADDLLAQRYPGGRIYDPNSLQYHPRTTIRIAARRRG